MGERRVKGCKVSVQIEVGDLVEIMDMPMERRHPENRFIKVGDQLRVILTWKEDTLHGRRQMLSFYDGPNEKNQVWVGRVKLIKKRHEIDEGSITGCKCPTLLNGHHFGCPLWSER